MSHISYPGEMVDVDVCTFAVMSYHVSSKFKIWNTLSIESTLVFSCLSALTLLVGRHEEHLAVKSACNAKVLYIY